jgi:flagellar biosynthesis chaperone FliJ
MPATPNWLSTLLRVREQRRDAALQSLAQSLSSAKTVQNANAVIEEEVSNLAHAQQSSGSFGRLDLERLSQFRQCRDDLRRRLAESRRRLELANGEIRQCQGVVTARDAERHVLQRLTDRLNDSDRVSQRRCEEQIGMESAGSLCNGDHSP